MKTYRSARADAAIVIDPDGRWIPADPNNRHFAAFKRLEAAGEAELLDYVAPEPVEAPLTVEERLDLLETKAGVTDADRAAKRAARGA